jgi:3-oxoacyl-[acyl-carrier protein] reductase
MPKVAWITGGGGEIGAACAASLHRHGYRLALSDARQEALDNLPEQLRAANPLTIRCDVTSSSEVDACGHEIVQKLGGIDVLVTCAGVLRDNLIFKMSDDDWHTVIGTHLTGTFFCARRAQVEMVESGHGRMIFLSSGASRGNRGQSNYSAAKAGIEALARTLALELGPFGINVNAIAPGFIDTKLTQEISRRTSVPWDEVKREAAERVPLRRIGQASDVADVVSFLVAADSSFMTGQTLFVRGGP